MTWTNRVVWQEGMFLRAQHFQQQDRWTEATIRASLASITPHRWGLVEGTLDRDLLTSGRFAFLSATGVFEDGTPFAMPGDADLPIPLEPGPAARNVLVYLSIPLRQAGSIEMTVGGDEEGQFSTRSFTASDTQSGALETADLLVARSRLRYLLETDDRAGYVCIPLARIVEVTSDRRVVLDQQWIPPVLTCAAAPPLAGLVVELAGLLNQRGDAIAGRLNATTTRSNTEVADFMLLQALNGWQVLVSHYADAGNLHPEALYRELLRMAGQLATFTDQQRRPSVYPAYRHEDLQLSFAPVIADIRRSLSAVLEVTAVRIPLEERRHGVRVGAILDRTLLANSSFILVVQSEMPTETLRRLFPNTVKIGAVEHIRELVNVALPGIAINALPVAPRQMPFIVGASYFELDRQSPHWQQMRSSGGFALHVSGDIPRLSLELWAIRS